MLWNEDLLEGQNLSMWREDSFCLWLSQTLVKLGRWTSNYSDIVILWGWTGERSWKRISSPVDSAEPRKVTMTWVRHTSMLWLYHHFLQFFFQYTRRAKNRTTGNGNKNKFVGFLLKMSGGRPVFILTWTQWLSTTEELLPRAPLTRQTLWLGRPINYRRDLKTSCFFPFN